MTVITAQITNYVNFEIIGLVIKLATAIQLLVYGHSSRKLDAKFQHDIELG